MAGVWRILQLTCVLAVVATVVVIDGKKCSKKGDKGDTKCKKKRGSDKKTRTTRSDKGPIAPYWRKRPPKDNQEIVREGSDVTLNCAIKGSPNPDFSWLRNGRSLTVTKKSKKYRQKRTKLIIKSATVTDSAKYTCIAKNELGTLNFTYTVKVLEHMVLKDIEVVDSPENQTAHPGDTVIFHCRSQDWPKPTVFWTRKTDSKNIMEVVSANANSSEELVLYNVTKEDSGVYMCSIGNEMVNKEFSARLTVINEDEKLPFEPQCSLHIRHEHIVDHKTGCRTKEPMEMYYCMGSCGRSYFVPQVITSDTPTAVIEQGGHLNQTCKCCVGIVDALRVVQMDCALGTTKRAFYTKLRDCQCQTCATQAANSPLLTPTG